MTGPWQRPLDRRAALKLGAITSATALFADCADAVMYQQDSLIKKQIPRTGEKIPAIGLGSAGTFNLVPGDAAYAEAREVVRLFHDLGGTVIDTSPTYQRSEVFLGETLKALQLTNDMFISTKVNVGSAGKAAAKQQMEFSSATYGRPVIDLMQVWNLGDSIRSLTDRYLLDHIEAVAEWKAAKRTRYIGITTSRDPQYADVEAALRNLKIDFLQIDYSIGDRLPDQRLLPMARERGIAVIVNRPFSTGGLFRQVAGKKLPPWAAEFDCASWAQYFLKFIVSHPAVTTTVPATGDPGHLRDNMGACFGRLPDEKTRAKMISYFETI